MRMRSRSVAVPSSTAPHHHNNNHNHVSAASNGASRSVLNIPGELKLHYSEVVNVAEKLSRLFSRTHTYHVHRKHKTLRQEPSNSWVTVHNLKQLDGGILDPDDRLNDVADDREQIIAIYDEQSHHHHHHHGGGDGTSASSDSENPSPDIFQGVEHKFAPFTRNDIEITGEELNATPPPLHVRRGSEPALNRLSPIPPANVPPDPTKRWSAAPIIEDQNAPPSSTPLKMVDGHSSYEDDNVFVDPGERGEGSGEEKTPSSSSSSSHHSASTAFTRFSRDTNRCSVQVLSDNPAMARWADAADRIVGASEGRRREPLGGSASSPMHSRDPSHDDSANYILVVLSNDRGPLGIHVIPSTDGTGHDQGLLVEGVEPGGRIARDGRIEVHDRIIEINGKPLNNITFQKAQEIFKDAMLTPELRLRVVKWQRQERQIGYHNELVEGEEKLAGGAKMASVTSTRKVPPASLSSRTQAVILQSNTRKIGRRLNVHLTKGQHGLGFSITTRDNPAGGEAPIYIKNILPKGAAIEDGNLRIGDRLLEVNGVEVTGRSQSEVAVLLREIPIGGVATLTVSRQDQRNGDAGIGMAESAPEMEKPPSPKLPRQLVTYHQQDSLPFFRQPAEKAAEDSLMFPWKQREILMFEIPVHDSERAGLGVSVKGKTSSGPNGSVDLGIFVKNVIHGGAASRDGRLFQNDQLVNINGMSLLGKPNSEAMKTLRTAMHQEGPTPGIISLTVARRIDHKERSSPSSNNRSGRESANSLLTNSSGTETLGGAKSSPATPTPDHSGATDASDATIIFNDHKYDVDMHETDKGDFGQVNPVIQRLTGNNGALRNESYYKATHDTWNTSQLQQLVMRGERESVTIGGPGMNPLGSPTVNLPSRDTLIIHDDAGNHMSREMCRSEGPGASAGSYSDHPSQSDDAYTSQTSLDENAAGFSRDQFGRQSMSEKRHATLDAKNTDTYQRNKKAREEREKQKQMMLAQEKLAASQGMGMSAMDAARNRELLSRDAVMGKLVRASSDESLASQNLQRTNHAHEPSPHDLLPPQDGLRSRLDVGPGLGMKKSSSLESLQTMVQEMALEEEGHRMGSGRVPRGRGCNESFRAAVDRSYDVPLTGLRNKMETLAEEESESSGSGFGRGNSRQSSVSSAVDDKYKKVGKKKQGIFKGLGSMFRFGKHRKSIDNPNGLMPKGEMEGDKPEGRGEVDRAEFERLAAARRLQQEEHDRMQEQYRRMIENTARTNQQQPQMRPEDGEPSRSERMHQLRAEHQRRHMQRNRTYPTDDLEERYESAIKQVLGESGESEADKANNNTLNSNDTKPQVMSENIVHRRSKTPKPSSSSSSSGNSNKTRGAGNPNRHSFHGTSSRSSSTGGTVNRNSLYVSCIKPVTDSPSPPLSPTVPKPDPPPYVPPPNKYVYNDVIYSKPCKESKEVKNTSESIPRSRPPSSVNDEMQVNNLSNFIIQNSLSAKPPLPPRNRPVNNNYKPPLPPSNPKPKKLTSPSPVPINQPTPNQSTCKSSSQSSDFSHMSQINPNFTFSFTKSISGAVTLSHPSNKPPTSNQDVVNRNLINQNLDQHNSTFVVYSSNNNPCNGGGHTGMFGDSGSNRLVMASSVMGGGANYPNTNGNNCIYSTAAPLSSNSSSSSTGSSSGAPRTNSLPRMGVKGKAAAMSARGSPCPPPPPPPKAAPNPLAALRSTAILDNSLFWGHGAALSLPTPCKHRRSQSQDLIGEKRTLSRIRERLDPVPSEPKPDIRHMRSHSYDLYGDNAGRPGSRTAYADPHKYSHYVNYEQIQQHLRKNKEQERLKKLASQQYQDFREKQTRRQQEPSTTLLHKLEETFIHESIIASREAREYQSQRGPRDSAREHQHRPVSNYYEYESVQAMISHAQDNSSTSLPRRHHPPPPGPPPVAAAAVAKNAGSNNGNHTNTLFPGVTQPHHMTMYKQTSGSSVHSAHSAHGGQMGNFGQSMSHMTHRGHSEHEGLYGSSYRPASHYTGPHHKPPQPPPHHHTTTLTVPGSKV